LLTDMHLKELGHAHQYTPKARQRYTEQLKYSGISKRAPWSLAMHSGPPVVFAGYQLPLAVPHQANHMISKPCFGVIFSLCLCDKASCGIQCEDSRGRRRGTFVVPSLLSPLKGLFKSRDHIGTLWVLNTSARDVRRATPAFL